MSIMTLKEWKEMTITQVVLKELRSRQQEAKDKLASSAGIDPLSDRYNVGAIAAYQDILDIELDEESNGN